MGPEGIEHGPDEGIVHLIVLEKIASDQEGIGLFADRKGEGLLQRRKSSGAKLAGLWPELRKTGPELPVCGVNEPDHFEVCYTPVAKTPQLRLQIRNPGSI
jgi:hypothetical protein